MNTKAFKAAINIGDSALLMLILPEEEWTVVLQRREWIEDLIEETEHALHSI